VLVEGWRSGAVAWYANPLFIAAFAAAAGRCRRTAVLASAAAVAVALTTLALFGQESEGSGATAIAPASGFYFWLAAHAALFAWAYRRNMLVLRATPCE
jgi:hypothetical protein